MEREVTRRKRTNPNVPAKGRLRDIADQLWSLVVRDDWDFSCAVCGHGKTDAHHVIPRQHEATRYSLRNGIALCARHHQFDPYISPHQNAAGWLLWLFEHESELHNWYTETNANNAHKSFTGTANAAYYCDVIRELKEHVPDKDYERIVGVRFAKWLEAEAS